VTTFDLERRATPQLRTFVHSFHREHPGEYPVLEVVHVVGGRVGEIDDLCLEAWMPRTRRELGGPVLAALVFQE